MTNTAVEAHALRPLLEEYQKWCRGPQALRYGQESEKEGWNHPWQEPFVELKDPIESQALAPLIKAFGPLPKSYVEVMGALGNSSFRSGSYGLLKVLSPASTIELYDNVQSQMDFSDGLREEILEEDGIDFSKCIPVMAGTGTDGCWALLDLSSATGQIFYWDNDQAGNMEDVYHTLAAFIGHLVESAKGDRPPRLT